MIDSATLPRVTLHGRVCLCVALSALLCVGLSGIATAAKQPDQYYGETVRELGGNHWALSVVNTNPNAKFIGTFWWVPPAGMSVTALKGVTGGTCSLIAGNVISCKGDVAPPNCNTCVGATMTVEFTATGNEPTFIKTSYGGYYIHYGVLGLLNITSLKPACRPNQVSTKAKPCSIAT